MRDTCVGLLAVCAWSPRVGADVAILAVLASSWQLVAYRLCAAPFVSSRYGRPIRLPARGPARVDLHHRLTLRRFSCRPLDVASACTLPPLSAQSRRLAVYGAARARLPAMPSSHGEGGQLLPRPRSAQARHARPNPSLFPLAPLLLRLAVTHINLAGGVVGFDSTRPQLAD
jgi:hypothetical protein